MSRSGRWLAALTLMATPAAAQTQPTLGYLGITAGSHLERSDAVRGSAPSVGVVGGVRLARAWAVEIEYDRPTDAFVRERTCQCFSLATTAADFARLAVTEQRREERAITSTVSVGAVYQPPLGNWTPRLFLGLTRHRVRESQSSTILAVPEGFDPVAVAARVPPSSVTRTLGGVTWGGGVSYQLTRHLAVGGDAKYDYGSLGDEINNAWRTSLRTTWSF